MVESDKVNNSNSSKEVKPSSSSSSSEQKSNSSKLRSDKLASRSRKFFSISKGDKDDLDQKKSKQLDDNKSQNEDDKLKLIETIRNSIIGDDETFKSPFGYRKITYCDYIASGRALSFIEDFIRGQVLPMYANTHTTTSITGLQSTTFRYEAREIVFNSVNGEKKDRVIFCGSGATSALNKLVHCLLKNDTAVGHFIRKAVVFVGPYEHHSNLLPWREACAEIVTIQEDQNGNIDIEDLKQNLIKYSTNSNYDNYIKIGAFSAASNVTGILTDTNTVTALLHKYDVYSVWDYACAAPYVNIDMNPVVEGYNRNQLKKDAIIFSPHKFIGGVETPGVLVAKKHMFKNPVPENPGGGTVFFVTDKKHRYLKKTYEREEGGTPSIVGAIRCGMCFQLKNAIGSDLIEMKERSFITRALKTWSSNPNIAILGSTKVDRLGIVSFLIRYKNRSFLHYNFISILLNDLFGIQVRGGCACAGPYALKLLGITDEKAKAIEESLLKDDDYEFMRPGFVRLSFNYFIDEETFDYIVKAVSFIADNAHMFLPLYTFVPETGEFVHYLNKKFNATQRRWLHNISYKDGKFSYRYPVVAKVKNNVFPKYLEEAEEALREATEKCKSNTFKVINQGSLLPEEAEALRWFVYPSEVLADIKDPSIEHTIEGSSISPKIYNTLDQVHSSSVVEQDTKPLQHPISIPDSNSIKKAIENIIGNKEEEVDTDSNIESFQIESIGNDQDEEYENPFEGMESDSDSDTEEKVILWPNVPDKKLYTPVKRAVFEYNMIRDGDRLLLGLSGGKDSLTLLHILHQLKKKLNIKFDIGCCTVDPQTDSYDPSPLIKYLKELDIPYFFESQNIIDNAKQCDASSICAWCSRMKRGILYNVARREGYNVLVLGQHLDDLAESFMMSIFHNGYLRTMKVHYTIDARDLRVIRPMLHVRERDIKEFARGAGLPIINENCPACFELPKERARMKTLLASQEHMYNNLFQSLGAAMKPLMLKDMEKSYGSNKKFKSNTKNILKNKKEFDESLLKVEISGDSQKVVHNRMRKNQNNTKEEKLIEEGVEDEKQMKQEDIMKFLQNVDVSLLEKELQRRKIKENRSIL